MKKIYNLIYVLVMLCCVQQMYGQTPVSRIVGPTDAQIRAVFSDPSITVTGGTLHSGVRNQQIATFSNGIAAGLEIDEGIFLGTGKVTGLLGLNNHRSYGDEIGITYNDPDLISINPESKYDVVSYSFQVTIGPRATKLSITYQFGSEEYSDYVGTQMIDIFGFFVTGPGIIGTQNLAKLPNGNNTTVNKVNFGAVGYSGDNPIIADFDGSQSALYINNGHPTNIVNGRLPSNNNTGPKPVAVQFNGLTKAITFDIKNLVPGATYTFKMSIADTVDGFFDAGVFIKKGSLVSMADVQANPDTYNLACGVLTTASVLANDTYNNAVATTTDVQLSAVSFPSGFTLNADGTISVASTVTAGTYNLTYSICDKTELTNCSTGTVSITVPANKTVTSNPTRNLPVNTALTPAITHTTTGVTGIGAATGLPAGVTASFASNTITISGTPTVSGTFNYSIPLLGNCGTLNATGTIVVGCTTPTAPVASASTLSNFCPVATADLTTLQPAGVNGIDYEWHTVATNPTVLTKVDNPSAVSVGGIYYLYSKTTTGGCYSNASSPVTVTINPCSGCTNSGVAFVNLNTLYTGTHPDAPNTVLEWWTTATRVPGTKVSDPTHVSDSGTYYAFFYDTPNDCYNTNNSTASVVVNILPPCATCTKPGDISTTGGIPTKVGITVQAKQANWPENIPNGFIALQSQNKGMVITRVAKVGGGDGGAPDSSDSINDPKEGMLVYDMNKQCVKLFNGTIWKCIQGCD